MHRHSQVNGQAVQKQAMGQMRRGFVLRTLQIGRAQFPFFIKTKTPDALAPGVFRVFPGNQAKND
jgi:hypothetical protein